MGSGLGPLDGGHLGPARCAVTQRGPHEGAHRAPIICQACPPSAIMSAGETGEPGVRDGQDFSALASLRYPGQRFLPTSRTCAARPASLLSGSKQGDRATDAGGLRRYKACAARTCSRAARPGRRDPSSRASGHVSADHVVAKPGRRCSRASPDLTPSSGGPSGGSPLCRQAGVFSIRADGLYRLARPFVPRRAELDELSQQVFSY